MLKQHYWNLRREWNTRRQVAALRRKIRRDEPIVLIHQPGRVGSMTISETTRSLLTEPVYHTHFINKQLWQERHDSHKRSFGSVRQRHMRISQVLAEALDRGDYTGEMKVVATVREPLGRELSTFFLDIEKHHIPDFYQRYSAGELDLEQLKKRFFEDRQFLNRDNWLDAEIRQPLGIDVYETPFDFNRRFNIYRKDNVELLIFRIEDVNDVIEPAYRAFFGIAPDRLLNQHVTSGESFEGAIYRDVLERLRFPEAFLEQIYGTRFARHFYSEDERRASIARWSEAAQPVPAPDGLPTA